MNTPFDYFLSKCIPCFDRKMSSFMSIIFKSCTLFLMIISSSLLFSCQLIEHHHILDHDSPSDMILEPEESEHLEVSASPSTPIVSAGDSLLVRPKLLFASSRSKNHGYDHSTDDTDDYLDQRNYNTEDEAAATTQHKFIYPTSYLTEVSESINRRSGTTPGTRSRRSTTTPTTTSTTAMPDTISNDDDSAAAFHAAAASIFTDGPSVITHSSSKKEEEETKIESDNGVQGSIPGKESSPSGVTTEATFSTSVQSSVTIKKKHSSPKGSSSTTPRPESSTTTSSLTTTKNPKRRVRVSNDSQNQPIVYLIHESDVDDDESSSEASSHHSGNWRQQNHKLTNNYQVDKLKQDLESLLLKSMKTIPPSGKSRRRSGIPSTFSDEILPEKLSSFRSSSANSYPFQSIRSNSYDDDGNNTEPSEQPDQFEDDPLVTRASEPIAAYPPINYNKLYNRGLLIYLKDFRNVRK